MSLVLTDDRRIVLRLEPISVPVSGGSPWMFQNRSKRTRCAVDGRKLSAGNEPESTVRADAGGHPSYFAVCPACGNPILICNPVQKD